MQRERERDRDGDNRQHREKCGDVIEVGGGRGQTKKRRKKKKQRHGAMDNGWCFVGVRRQGEQEWAAKCYGTI